MMMMELGRQLDLLTKLKKVEEESDESMFWLDHILLVGLDPALTVSAKQLHRRCDEVTALVVTAIKTVRRRIEAKRKR